MLAKDLAGQNLKKLAVKTGLSENVLHEIVNEANKIVGVYWK